ncbi:hypothetical protein [Streptomyces sp. NPDC088246]|uniref:hypothetical protein n=1 Tax=Streptomyces sp. NPDC088246 TaxID=3365842 RepID=UPI0037F2E740
MSTSSRESTATVRSEAVEVARRAGHGTAVLFRLRAKILRARQDRANQLINRGLSSDDEGDHGPHMAHTG